MARVMVMVMGMVLVPTTIHNDIDGAKSSRWVKACKSSLNSPNLSDVNGTTENLEFIC